jgi:hypothetical protein
MQSGLRVRIGHRWVWSIVGSLVALLVVALVMQMTDAQANPIQYEPIYYDDQVYIAQNPGGHSHNHNQLTFGCFNLGPDLNGNTNSATIPIYAILWSGATQHVCPDGSLAHDHVAVAIPGTPDFTPHWRVVFVIPVSEADMELPLTSEAAVNAAIAAGQVVTVDTGLVINAPVVRRSGQ